MLYTMAVFSRDADLKRTKHIPPLFVKYLAGNQDIFRHFVGRLYYL